jgi:hypothetical protein
MPEGRTSELISGMSFLGVRHDKNKETIDLLPWGKKSKDRFVVELEKKFNIYIGGASVGGAELKSDMVYEKIDEGPDKETVKKIFNANITEITNALDLKCITTDEDLLFINGEEECYVYFGGMTSTLVYVACWMVVPTDSKSKPKLLFWFLNTFYVQQLQSLEANEVNIANLEACTDLTSSPDF